MIIEWTYIEVRPNKNSSFHKFEKELLDYMSNTYGSGIDDFKGKAFENWEYSDDGLTRRGVVRWTNLEMADQFESDPKLIDAGNKKEQWCEENDIQRYREVKFLD